MALVVLTYKRQPDSGEIVFSDYPIEGEDIAGSESWRKTVWGSQEVIDLKAQYLPQLQSQDLYIENHELEAFRKECETLIAYYTEQANFNESILYRLSNLLKAANKANQIGGGIYIG